MSTLNNEKSVDENIAKKSPKKILIILPHYNFRDKEYKWLVERLETAGVTAETAANHLSEAQGRFGTLVKPDALIEYVEASDYDAFVFIGEESAETEFINDKNIHKILETAFSRHKIVAAIGAAVPIIAVTGHLVGKRITAVESEKQRLEDLGAFYTGRLVEQDGDIITANGPYATREFADSIIKALKWSEGKGDGRKYLR